MSLIGLVQTILVDDTLQGSSSNDLAGFKFQITDYGGLELPA